MATITLGFKPKATAAAKTEKPIMPDTSGTLRPLVDAAIDSDQNIKAHKLALDGAKGQFAVAAFDYVARTFAGRTTIEDTVRVIGRQPGNVATICLKNAYKMPADVEQVRAVLGQHADTYLTQSYELSIDLDAMPENMTQYFVDELMRIAREIDAMNGTPPEEDGPVFSAIAAKSVVKLTKAFHEARWALFTPEQNKQIQTVVPCIISTSLKY